MKRCTEVLALLISIGLGGACASDTDTAPSAWTPGDKSDQAGDCHAPSVQAGEWVHSTLVHLTTGQGDAHHGAADVVINPGDAAKVSARFAYGPFLKDLEDENISAWIEVAECSWQPLGVSLTDDSGTVTFSVPPSLAAAPGRHDIRFEVNGDGSDVYSSVWVEDAGQPAVIFDIDGTLTSSDTELFKNILLGDDPEMYESASDVAWAYADRGYQVIYITGRPVYLDGRSRHWLADHDFPRGPLKLVIDTNEALPFEAFVGAFKQRTIEALQDEQGLAIDFAYGNATTDICAYAGSEIPTTSTFIIGTNGGGACNGGAPTQAVASYPEHLLALPEILDRAAGL